MIYLRKRQTGASVSASRQPLSRLVGQGTAAERPGRLAQRPRRHIALSSCGAVSQREGSRALPCWRNPLPPTPFVRMRPPPWTTARRAAQPKSSACADTAVVAADAIRQRKLARTDGLQAWGANGQPAWAGSGASEAPCTSGCCSGPHWALVPRQPGASRVAPCAALAAAVSTPSTGPLAASAGVP
jgi:hypothetical protein